MKFVIDLMGGDNSSKATIPAIIEASKIYKDVIFYCVGNKECEKELNNLDNVKFVESKTVIRMDENPMEAYKDLDSSLMVGMKTYLDNKCDAFISAGSSGCLLAASIFKIKRIPGVSRPGFITSFPTYKENKKFVICDLGANNQNTPEELHSFAIMANLYSKILYKIDNPKVALLSNGTEEEKGSPLNKEAYKLIKEDKSLNFVGNCEARDPMFGEIDVVVCDGFSGNIYLKANEGMAKVMSNMMKDAFKRNIFSKIGYLLSKKGFDEMKKKMDYKNVGGALVVGVNGVVIKAHGNSDPKAFLSAIRVANEMCNNDVVNKMKELIK